ncbi:MAG: type II secretion system F family protein [Velocimicrobium sp.]
MRKSKEQYRRERLWELNLAFKEALGGVIAALTAGYSIENSFREAQKDLSLIYQENVDIMQELMHINNQIRCNQRVEDLLLDFANRSHLEDIHNFTEVFVMAKRSGGNLLAILNQTVRNISDKIEIKREIQTLIAGKQLEAKIMTLIPIGIIAYMRIFSPGFMNVLYHNVLGICIMTVALLLYGLGVYLAEKIVDIEV